MVFLAFIWDEEPLLQIHLEEKIAEEAPERRIVDAGRSRTKWVQYLNIKWKAIVQRETVASRPALQPCSCGGAVSPAGTDRA